MQHHTGVYQFIDWNKEVKIKFPVQRKNITKWKNSIEKDNVTPKRKTNNWPDSIKLSISSNHHIIICINASINLNSFFNAEKEQERYNATQ